ncbi:MAG: DNA polymerase III subunit delta' [Pseudomonadota bacterium]
MANIFPWCESTWAKLLSSMTKNRFPHALLFYGNDGLGKAELALQLAEYLLCSDPHKNKLACRVCKDCVLFSAKTHGDFYHITPEGDSKSIGVDQIRALKTAAHQKPQRSKNKVFIMPRADKMTIAASNALLKILEEPPGDSIFILTSERKNFLSPTILSRCHHYGFSSTSSEKTAQWLLENTGNTFSKEIIKEALLWSLGAPLLAKQLLQDNVVADYQSYVAPLLAFFAGKTSLFSLSKAWQGKSLPAILYVSQVACYYLLKGEWGEDFNKRIIYQWVKKIAEIKKLLSTHIALNDGLMLEALLAS